MSITRHDGKNISSLSAIYLKLKSEITDTQTPVSGLSISDDITLTGSWTALEVVPGQGSWQEVVTEDESGETYTYTIQGVIHSDRADITTALQALTGRELMALCTDRQPEASTRLLGETGGVYDYHCRITWQQVKEKSPGRNAYDITITCEMHHPAYYYSGAID